MNQHHLSEDLFGYIFWNIHHNHATKTGPDVEDQRNSYIRQLKLLPAMQLPLLSYLFKEDKVDLLLLLKLLTQLRYRNTIVLL